MLSPLEALGLENPKMPFGCCFGFRFGFCFGMGIRMRFCFGKWFRMRFPKFPKLAPKPESTQHALLIFRSWSLILPFWCLVGSSRSLYFRIPHSDLWCPFGSETESHSDAYYETNQKTTEMVFPNVFSVSLEKTV